MFCDFIRVSYFFKRQVIHALLNEQEYKLTEYGQTKWSKGVKPPLIESELEKLNCTEQNKHAKYTNVVN